LIVAKALDETNRQTKAQRRQHSRHCRPRHRRATQGSKMLGSKANKRRRSASSSQCSWLSASQFFSGLG
jgi:hypothetical protein